MSDEVFLGSDRRYMLTAVSHGADMVTVTLEEIDNSNKFSVEVDNCSLAKFIEGLSDG